MWVMCECNSHSLSIEEEENTSLGKKSVFALLQYHRDSRWEQWSWSEQVDTHHILGECSEKYTSDLIFPTGISKCISSWTCQKHPKKLLSSSLTESYCSSNIKCRNTQQSLQHFGYAYDYHVASKKHIWFKKWQNIITERVEKGIFMRHHESCYGLNVWPFLKDFFFFT